MDTGDVAQKHGVNEDQNVVIIKKTKKYLFTQISDDFVTFGVKI